MQVLKLRGYVQRLHGLGSLALFFHILDKATLIFRDLSSQKKSRS
jgi:hypothetical protein